MRIENSHIQIASRKLFNLTLRNGAATETQVKTIATANVLSFSIDKVSIEMRFTLSLQLLSTNALENNKIQSRALKSKSLSLRHQKLFPKSRGNSIRSSSGTRNETKTRESIKVAARSLQHNWKQKRKPIKNSIGWIPCNKRMERYKNKKAINSRALENTCRKLHFYPKPLAVHCRDTHSIPFIIRRPECWAARKKLFLLQFNGHRKMRRSRMQFRSYIVTIHRHILWLFLAKSSFLRLPTLRPRSLPAPIIVIIKVKYSSNLGWYSPLLDFSRKQLIISRGEFLAARCFSVSALNIPRWDKLRQFRCSRRRPLLVTEAPNLKHPRNHRSHLQQRDRFRVYLSFAFASWEHLARKRQNAFVAFFAAGNLITLIVQ